MPRGFSGSIPALASWLRGAPGNWVRLWTSLYIKTLSEGHSTVQQKDNGSLGARPPDAGHVPSPAGSPHW